MSTSVQRSAFRGFNRLAMLVAACAAMPRVARADSPLTSTPIHQAYSDIEAVRRAEAGVLDESIARALFSSTLDMGTRAAIVSALGWRFDGSSWGRQAIRFLAQFHGVPVERLGLTTLTGAEALVLGYAIALDTYHDVRPIGGELPLEQVPPQEMLQYAQLREPASFTVDLVLQLVRAQRSMDVPGNWCLVFRQYEGALLRYSSSARDLRPQAVEVVSGYMESYRQYCAGEGQGSQGALRLGGRLPARLGPEYSEKHVLPPLRSGNAAPRSRVVARAVLAKGPGIAEASPFLWSSRRRSSVRDDRFAPSLLRFKSFHSHSRLLSEVVVG